MGRGSLDLVAAAAAFVPVKVTDLRDLDVANVRFDFDLTFAALTMHADGTVYHRYGGRLPDRADGYLSLTSLARLLRDTVPEHAAYDAAPERGSHAPHTPQAPPQRAIDLPFLRQRLAAGQKIDCVHCHTVHDAEHRSQLRREAHADAAYVFPDPERIGLTLDRERQALVTAVAAASPAAAAGLRAGDELRSLGVQDSVRTLADVQWALDRAPCDATELAVRYRRGDEELAATLALPAGWKRCDPRDYAWRPYKWNLSPAAGFGGPALTAAQKQQLGIAPDKFAFRVQYLVDWGDRAHRGRAARGAGLQKDDVVVAFAGKDDFASVEHFQAWVSLAHTAGEQVEFVVLRKGQRLALRYALPE